MASNCTLGIQNLVKTTLNNKPWFEYDQSLGIVNILDSPKYKINKQSSFGVAKVVVNAINKQINNGYKNIGDIAFAKFDEQGRGYVDIAPTINQIQLINAQNEEEIIELQKQLDEEELLKGFYQTRETGNYDVVDGEIVPFFENEANLNVLNNFQEEQKELDKIVTKINNESRQLDLFESFQNIITNEQKPTPIDTTKSDGLLWGKMSSYESETNFQPTESKSQFRSDNSLQEKINGRDFKEIWNSNEFTQLERENILLHSIQERMLDKNTFNGELFAGINSKLGKLELRVVDNEKYPFLAFQKQIYINPKIFLKYLQNANIENVDKYLDLTVSEELIHVLTNYFTSLEDIKKIATEINPNNFKYIQSIYKSLPSGDFELGTREYLRMIVQQEILGTTTEKIKYTKNGVIDSIIDKIWNFLYQIFKDNKGTLAEKVKKHIDFIKSNNVDSTNNYKPDILQVEDSFLNQDIKYQLSKEQSKGIIASEKTIRDLAARMSDRIGIPVRYISDRSQQFKGKLENGTAVINLAYATLDTPIHEILGHPIIRAIKKKTDSKAYYEIDKSTDKFTIVKNQLGGSRVFDTKQEAEDFIKSENTTTLYQNLLKELEYGKGKEVLDRIKRDYKYKVTAELIIDRFGRYGIKQGNSEEFVFDTKEEAEGQIKKINSKEYTLEEQQEEAIVELLGLYTAEKLDNVKDGKLISLLKRLLKEMKQFVRSLLSQREVEIDKLPDNMTLGDLSDLLAYSNSKLILPGYEVIYTTPDNEKFKTYQEASNHISELAKSVKDVDLDSVKINTETPEEQKRQIKQFTEELKDLRNQFNNFKFEKIPFNNKIDIYTEKGRLRQNYWARREDGTTGYLGGSKETLTGDDYDGFVLDKRGDPNAVQNREYIKISDDEAKKIFDEVNDTNTATRASIDIYNALARNIDVLENRLNALEEGSPLKNFISKNKEYEQSKEIIEEWKKVNNIHYNPEEIYSRGQEFVSVVGAYSDFDVNLMMQNLLAHIEDNEKAGGKFAISAYTKPIDRQIGHLEGGGGKIKFKINPQSQDILWAANTDVYSGSVWDASEKVNKDKKSELLGVSYTKYPSLRNVNAVQPNLAAIVDDLSHHHNELGISLTGNNFRLEYDENIPYSTKKIINSINSILDQKYGKLVKPNIENKQTSKESYSYNDKIFDKLEMYEQDGTYIYELTNTKTGEKSGQIFAKSFKRINDKYGIQPTQTNETLKESIDSVKNKLDNRDNLLPTKFLTKGKSKGYSGDTWFYKENGEWYMKYVPYDAPFDTEVESYDITKMSDAGLSIDEVWESYIKENPSSPVATQKEKEYTSQALINTKIAALKEVAKKYPRSLIRSEVKPIKPFDTDSYTQFNDELPFQKISQSLSKEQLDAIDNVFDENPELADAVTKEQYREYINSLLTGETISNQAGDLSKSQVKDIVYHGGKVNKDTFKHLKNKEDYELRNPNSIIGFFFSNSKKTVANQYAQYDYDNIPEDLQKALNDSRDDPEAYRFYSESIPKKPGSISEQLLNIKKPFVIQAKEWEDESWVDKFNILTNSDRDDNWVSDYKWTVDAYEKIKNYLKNLGYDSLYINSDQGLFKKTGVVDYITVQKVVFEPEQIHILSSKSDIEQAKEFISNNNNQKTEDYFSNEINKIQEESKIIENSLKEYETSKKIDNRNTTKAIKNKEEKTKETNNKLLSLGFEFINENEYQFSTSSYITFKSKLNSLEGIDVSINTFKSPDYLIKIKIAPLKNNFDLQKQGELPFNPIELKLALKENDFIQDIADNTFEGLTEEQINILRDNLENGELNLNCKI